MISDYFIAITVGSLDEAIRFIFEKERLKKNEEVIYNVDGSCDVAFYGSMRSCAEH